jgi:hypothetical protein
LADAQGRQKESGRIRKKKVTTEHIVKHGSGYRLLSHKGKNLGTFSSYAGAAKHEGEVEHFKSKEQKETEDVGTGPFMDTLSGEGPSASPGVTERFKRYIKRST